MLTAKQLEPFDACFVCGSCGGCKGMLDHFLQVDSQSVLRTPGVGVALGSACGAREKKRVNCCLDNASAMEFSFPGR